MINELAHFLTRSDNVYFASNKQASIRVFTAVFCFTYAEHRLIKLKLLINDQHKLEIVCYVKFKETTQICSALKITLSVKNLSVKNFFGKKFSSPIQKLVTFYRQNVLPDYI